MIARARRLLKLRRISRDRERAAEARARAAAAAARAALEHTASRLVESEAPLRRSADLLLALDDSERARRKADLRAQESAEAARRLAEAEAARARAERICERLEIERRRRLQKLEQIELDEMGRRRRMPW